MSIRQRWFPLTAISAAVSGTTLGEGIAHGWLLFIAAGTVMSAVSPWGVLTARFISRRRRR